MKISYQQFISFLLLVFLLNSAGVFSPSLTIRDGDFSSDVEVSSNIINRLVMLGAFFVAIYFLLKTEVKYYAKTIAGAWPLWVLLFYSLLSCIWSDMTLTSFTRLMQQVFLITFIILVITYLSFDHICDVLKVFSMIIIIIGVLSLPFTFAWQDIGFRSIHGHKNTAGYIFALAGLIYLCEIYIKGHKTKFNYLFLILVLFLLVISKSKTSLALMIFSYMFVVFLKFNPKVNAKAVIFFIVGIASFTFLSLLLSDSEKLISLGLDFTGRTTIWQFVLFEMQTHELLGFGYRAFWGVGEQGISVLYGGDFDFFITKLNQSHNSYLDIWVMLGYIGLVIFAIFIIHSIFIINKSNYLFVSMLTFFTLHSFMETDYFRSNNLLWVLYVLIYFSSLSQKNLTND
jgi:O-antigen ligase